LWDMPGVKENLEESARIFFSNNALTVNLIPALLVGLLGLFLLKPLFGIPILSQIFGAMTGGGASYGSNLEISDGYGAPEQSYGPPAQSYGPPAQSYAPPAQSYDAPSSGYDTPSSGYDAPTDGYSTGRRRRAVDLPSEARDFYSNMQPFRYVRDVEHVNYPDSAAFLGAEAAPVGSVDNFIN
jgi:hypothetical protein